MKLSLYTDDLRDASTDVVAIGVFSDEPDRGVAFSWLNRGLDGALEQACRDEEFKGTAGQTLVFNVRGGIAATRVLVYGYGERAGYGTEAARCFAGTAARVAERVSAKSVAIQLTVPEDDENDPVELVSALAEGVSLGGYKFSTHKTKDARPVSLRDARIAFVAEDVQGLKGTALRRALARGSALADAVKVARDLVNEPPNVLTPIELADRTKRIAKQAGLTFKLLNVRDLEKHDMFLHLGVGRGSENEPRLIHLTYTPEEKSTRAIAFVGKGITFDAGGLSLKTADGMIEMKTDMGGAAAVIGAMQAVAYLQPGCVVHGIIAAAENMPDGRAIRPGDVLRSKHGLSVEVINTDAEGRLVLADALAYAQDLKVDELVDVATLTGACMVALGRVRAGAWINDEGLAERLAAAWTKSGEAFWRMPLEVALEEELASEVADLKNVGTRYGGATTAALFLKNFIAPGTPWAHLDVAGPIFSSKAYGYIEKGGTGFAVRTLAEFAAAQTA